MEELIEKKENDIKKTKVKKEKRKGMGTVLGISILLSFVCGMLGAYLVFQLLSVEKVAKNMPTIVKNITTSQLIENSISSSVWK